MATTEDLERAIDQLLKHPLGVKQYQVSQRVVGKLYEAYVFGLCLRAVRELESSLTLCGIKGPSTPFIFRGAPGQIHSDAKNYGYAKFSLNDDYEIHAGIEFKGISGMTHELDVCIMKATYADKCRNPQSLDDPPARSLVCGWECKFYTGSLPKNLGREFVGLMKDMGGIARRSGLCSNSDHEQLRKYFSLPSRPYFCKKLTPLEPENEASFIYTIKTELRKLTAT